jgi:protein-S-isoprenylcysteine O-methyltransferase Ste14
MPEYVFRIVGVLLYVPYAYIRKAWQRRLRTHLSEKPTIELAPGRERWLLGILGTLTLPLIVWLVSPWVDFAHVAEVPEWARWVGAVAFAGGIECFRRTHVALAQNWTPVLEVREGDTLVTSGPYRLVRHPMYSSAYVINIGMSALSANWLVAVGLLVGLTLLYAVRVRDEEQLMIDAFGDEYRAYMDRTGRLVPKLGYLLRLQNRNDR